MHQHPLAGPETGAGHEGVVRGDEGLGCAAHREQIEAVGHGRALRGRNRDVFGLGPAARDPEHPGAHVDAGGVGAAGLDDPGELQARDVGRGARRRRVVAGELEQVGPVEAGAVHPHEHLVVDGSGYRPLGDLDAAVGDDRCSRGSGRLRHGYLSARWPWRSASWTRTVSRSTSTPTRPTRCSRSPAGSRRRPCRPAGSAARE